MEYPKDLLEEQKALLLDDLKFSDGIERIQDLKKLKEVNDALLILNEVNRSLPTKEELDSEIVDSIGRSLLNNNEVLDRFQANCIEDGFRRCYDWITKR